MKSHRKKNIYVSIFHSYQEFLVILSPQNTNIKVSSCKHYYQYKTLHISSFLWFSKVKFVKI